MIAHYGYTDGSGEFFIRIDTNLCNGCGDCLTACPAGILAVEAEDPYDPFREEPVAVVREGQRKKIKYACAPCKAAAGRTPLPCVAACRAGAIRHSW